MISTLRHLMCLLLLTSVSVCYCAPLAAEPRLDEILQQPPREFIANNRDLEVAVQNVVNILATGQRQMQPRSIREKYIEFLINEFKRRDTAHASSLGVETVNTRNDMTRSRRGVRRLRLNGGLLPGIDLSHLGEKFARLGPAANGDGDGGVGGNSKLTSDTRQYTYGDRVHRWGK